LRASARIGWFSGKVSPKMRRMPAARASSMIRRSRRVPRPCPASWRGITIANSALALVGFPDGRLERATFGNGTRALFDYYANRRTYPAVLRAQMEAGIAAIRQGEPFAEQFRREYRVRRDAVIAALGKIGIQCRVPEAAFYVWCKVPAGFTSAQFCMRVLQETGVVVTPGNGFGAPGEGYFRISLTVPTARLEEAVQRISKL